MNKYAIYHITDVPYVYAVSKEELIIRIRAAKNDLKKCYIYVKDRYDWVSDFNIYEMKLYDSTDLFDFYSVKVNVDKKRYRYFFKLEDQKGEVLYYNERGFVEEEPKEHNAFQFPYLCEADVYEEVKWAQEGIVYQIFPDRFCNGDSSNDPTNTKAWGGKVDERSMFGGDLQGIIDKVDYLKELGVTFIYMTPIFLSISNHKYNTCDYYSIDPHFGDINKAKELVKKCHEKGIKVLFDAVFNHSGHDFFAFKDVIEKGENSRYKDWFYIESFPIDLKKVNYVTFANEVFAMPKFNTHNEEVKKYLLDVAKFWIEEVDIDGWRLDVCDEVDHEFWREFRKTVKRSKKDAFIVGEIMHEASSFLHGEQLDTIMNYPFKNCCTDFFGKSIISAEEFNNILASARNLYMDSINRQMLNLIGSHDTPRFLTECEGDIRRLKAAIAFQYTYIGIPYIYYGDEVGIDGGADPQCRKCMIWDEKKQNEDVLNFYKTMANIRKENSTLIYGNYESLYSRDNVIAYRRKDDKGEIIVIINNNDKDYSLDLKELYENEFKDLIDNRVVSMDKPLCLKSFQVNILRVNN